MATVKVAGVDVSTAHFIDGKRVEAKRTFEVCSPINGKHLAGVSAGGADQIDEAVAAARRAFPKWAALGPEGRHPILSRFAKAILDHTKELSAVETEDNGSLLLGNVGRMVPRAAHNIQYFADRALKLNDQKIDSPEVVNHVRFDPADLDAAAQTAAGQYFNAGQVCLAGTRVLADAKIADEFLSKFRAAASQMTVGDPREKRTRVGPLITPEHYKRVEGFVTRALKGGVKPLWGGHRHAAGELYFEPTLIEGVEQDQEIVQREVFGPVLTWQTFHDEDEAIRLANGTDYGLAAVIFSRNEERAMRLARCVIAGTVWVNCFFVRDLGAPFGGSRNSGIGREGGNWSFDFYCDVKNIAASKGSFA